MLNNKVRVENEVAAISLMKDALSALPTRLVPDVYGWNTATEGKGWIVEECMHGESLSKRFSELSASQPEDVLVQVAHMFKLIQNYQLPPTVTGFGGLNFDSNGQVVVGGLTIWFGGPFQTFQDMYLHIFRKQLELSETTPLVNGWEGTDLRLRFQQFLNEGMPKVLENYGNVRLTLVHRDLGKSSSRSSHSQSPSTPWTFMSLLSKARNVENLLIDPETLQLTAILDFDFSHIASPADEYFYPFPSFHGIVAGPFEEGEQRTLNEAQLNGFKDFKTPTSQEEVDWNLAKTWHSALETAGVESPADIDGIDELAAVYWFLLDVCPPYFLLPRWLKRKTIKQQQALKKETEANLDKYLKRWGY
ncbi:uncharacterized protein PAC_17304 [Phialocephala subalpina]|uniref:Aminoglycoside phosphotransferase domain-containing protein n=1 Tax=Phialocephala subalpina TaxID=576137 RepID=A0A1L7XQX3_9HELO|nr:uncharacterized protein PAC_17304 [Phialocephala subalpina]